MSCWRDPQVQVSENYSYYTKWRPIIFKSCSIKSDLIKSGAMCWLSWKLYVIEQYLKMRIRWIFSVLMVYTKFKFKEATPRGVFIPVYKKTPEMPGFTKMTRLDSLQQVHFTISSKGCTKATGKMRRKYDTITRWLCHAAFTHEWAYCGAAYVSNSHFK